MEIGCVNGERWGNKVELDTGRQPKVALEARMKEINTALLQESGMVEEFDDNRTV